MKIVTSDFQAPQRGLAPTELPLGTRPGRHLWCIHCERAYASGGQRVAGPLEVCPYAGCFGAARFAWDWQRVRKVNPNYPLEPTRGVTYPLFGKGIYLRKLDRVVAPQPAADHAFSH